MKRRPNILLIMTDNQPAELLGCYGNSECRTPNIDALAADGFRFDNAFCVNGMCSPCRASVMTGLMPSQHGIHTWIDDRKRESWPENWNAIAEFDTLPEILSRHGYLTALIGKYHMGAPEKAQNGFQHWVTDPHGHVTDFWGRDYIENGTVETYAGHSVDFYTEKAVEFLHSAAQRPAPFFAFLPYNAPYGHWPALKGRARNRFRNVYDDTRMYSIPREGLHKDAIARFLRKVADSYGGVDHSTELRVPNDLETLRNYFSEMTMVDDGVKRVLAALRDLGIYDDTIIVYTTDHGFSLGHHGIWGHSQATLPAHAHRESFSIPLIVRHGDRLAKGSSSELVSQIDILPSLLDLAALPMSEFPATSTGRSFAGVLTEAPYEPREAVFLEQEETRAIRTSKWLFKHRFPGAPQQPFPDELYDLDADPREKHDLCGDAAYEVQCAQLRQVVRGFFDGCADPRYDLWSGGFATSGSDKQWLWDEAFGRRRPQGFC